MFNWYFHLDTFVVEDLTELDFLKSSEEHFSQLAHVDQSEFLAALSSLSENQASSETLAKIKWVNPFS